MKSKFVKVKLVLPAGEATIAPPVGTILGQYRIDMVGFCKSFNDLSTHFNKGTLIPVKIYLKVGGSFTFDIKSPATSYLFKRLIEESKVKGQKTLTPLMLYKVILLKNKANLYNNESLLKVILGTLKSMQLKKYHLS